MDRERAQGHYSALEYLAAKTAVELPMDALLAAVSRLPPPCSHQASIITVLLSYRWHLATTETTVCLFYAVHCTLLLLPVVLWVGAAHGNKPEDTS